MNKTYYVCKYTPIELLEAFGGECQNLNEMPQGFDHGGSDSASEYLWIRQGSPLEAVMSRKSKGTGAGQLL